MIILHCRVVYQSNVLPGQWTWLGMQSCSDYGFYGVVGREEGGEQNPHELKKKKKKHFWASDFYLFPLSH